MAVFGVQTRAHGDNRQCKHASLCVPMPQDMKPFNQPAEAAGAGAGAGAGAKQPAGRR